jgi:hypothetical protein
VQTYDRPGCFCLSRRALRSFCDGLHGLIERHAAHLDQEVNGVAAFVRPGGSPVAVLDDQLGVFDELVVVTAGMAQAQTLAFEDFRQQGLARGADLLSEGERGQSEHIVIMGLTKGPWAG